MSLLAHWGVWLGQSSRGEYSYFWRYPNFIITQCWMCRRKHPRQKSAQFVQLFRFRLVTDRRTDGQTHDEVSSKNALYKFTVIVHIDRFGLSAAVETFLVRNQPIPKILFKTPPVMFSVVLFTKCGQKLAMLCLISLRTCSIHTCLTT